MIQFSLYQTTNGSYRVLVNGKVHPLMCGVEDEADAIKRIKKVFDIDVPCVEAAV
jgi:hypothetical protein